jgi:hypothetical protein
MSLSSPPQNSLPVHAVKRLKPLRYYAQPASVAPEQGAYDALGYLLEGQ